MNDEDKTQVTKAAARFRGACERYRDEHENPFASMKYFPDGCCTLASEAFLRFLRDEEIGDGILLNFCRVSSSRLKHDIVLIKEWAVDITSDQFKDETRAVIVRSESDLPKKWRLLHRFTLDELAVRRNDPVLQQMYEDIKAYLPDHG